MQDSGLTFYVNGKYVYCQYYPQSGGIVQMSTGYRPLNICEYKKGKRSRAEAAEHRRLKTSIDAYELDCQREGSKTEAEHVRQLILSATNRADKPIRRGGVTFLQYFKEFLAKVEAGDILNDGKLYSESYKDSAKVVLNRWLPQSPIANISAGEIKESNLAAYAAYLTKAGLAKNSVASYIDPVVSFLNNGRRMDMHRGAMLDAKAYRVNREDTDFGVFLPVEEQEMMLRQPYEGLEEIWRDAFVLGCQVGMRYEDLAALTPRHRDGNLLNINTSKTTTPVWAPMNELARNLWDKYNGVLMVPTHTPFLKFIKQMGSDIGLTKLIRYTRTEGGKTVEYIEEKWKLLGTHSCRRSFATNAYKAGVDIFSIMKITGHRTTRNFLKYIRLSDEEQAVHTAQHPFFK